MLVVSALGRSHERERIAGYETDEIGDFERSPILFVDVVIVDDAEVRLAVTRAFWGIVTGDDMHGQRAACFANRAVFFEVREVDNSIGEPFAESDEIPAITEDIAPFEIGFVVVEDVRHTQGALIVTDHDC